MPFIIASKHKIFRNITKDMEDLCTENNKTLIKEIEDTHKWKDIPYSWAGRTNIVNCNI